MPGTCPAPFRARDGTAVAAPTERRFAQPELPGATGSDMAWGRTNRKDVVVPGRLDHSGAAWDEFSRTVRRVAEAGEGGFAECVGWACVFGILQGAPRAVIRMSPERRHTWAFARRAVSGRDPSEVIFWRARYIMEVRTEACLLTRR